MATPLLDNLVLAINSAASSASPSAVPTIPSATSVRDDVVNEVRSPFTRPNSPAPSLMSFSSMPPLVSLPESDSEPGEVDEDTPLLLKPERVAGDASVRPTGHMLDASDTTSVLTSSDGQANLADRSASASLQARDGSDADVPMDGDVVLAARRSTPPPSYAAVLRQEFLRASRPIGRTERAVNHPSSTIASGQPRVSIADRPWRLRTPILNAFSLSPQNLHDILYFLSLNQLGVARALEEIKPYELSSLKAGLTALHDQFLFGRRSAPVPPRLAINWVHKHVVHRHGIDYCVNNNREWLRDVDIPLYANGLRAVERYWHGSARRGRPYLFVHQIDELRVCAPQYHGNAGAFLDHIKKVDGERIGSRQ
ncbi:uncharacterized protein B0H18DRAFT_956490 [Fomitopsis serialis]|uniref:uncharacterized protein n=1 Tax=Fomitopsis serialis TaxID=139415 RepID=UPI0020074A55|nr:uncharacterized protein B0H18DRAFT_1197780 [Neoantrodia serialis]XP_047891087.1 uncharacterized protein B0H18DRAFT_956490 [Neoantrodia serialis]KAH9919052.1 hypothetical protein B0H18DRAFT_1197780 [Neoantrodia serialis]KAH9921913.1 hypothetical protein B0H18DRAFT_956490 [Neoantrodia serialis]